MRNYFKMQALRLYPLPFDINFFYVVFGGTDEQLLFFSNRLQAQLREGDPTITFQIPEPDPIWFLLDEDNFGRLLNQASGTIWTQTHLNNQFPPIDGLETLYDMTRVITEGSPRKTWAHGH